MMTDRLTSDLESLRIDRTQASRPKKRGPWKALGIIAVLVLIGAGGSYIYPHLEARVFKTEVQISEIALVSPSQGSTSLTATGYVVPLTITRVAPRTVGRVVRVLAKEGEHVAAGQRLFELDVSDQQQSIAAARARAFAARAEIATAQASLAEVTQQVERNRGLVAGKAVARSTLEDLEARRDALAAAVEAAKAKTQAAQAEIEVLRVGLEHLTVEAPIAGTILDKPPEVGEMLQPDESVMDIADMTSLVVEVDVPEARLNLIHIDGPCEIVLDAFPSKRYRGSVREMSRRVNRAKATVPVKVNFSELSDEVLPDMAAKVSFLTEQLTDEQLRAAAKTVVPGAAVVTRTGEKVVFVVEENVVHVQPVKLGNKMGEDFELIEGPSPGTRVVLNAPATLQEGSPVKEKE